MKQKMIPFSPPDITEAEADEVRDALLSGWITTGPRTKKLEKRIANYVGVNDGKDATSPNCICLNSQTACAEMALRLLGVGPGDEVIVPAYTYSASASIVKHVGADIVFIDSQKNNLEMDYHAVEAAISPKTKVIIPVDIGGIPCNYDFITTILEKKRNLFRPNSDIQRKIGRIAICSDSAHSLGGYRIKNGKKIMCGALADFSSFSFHAVKNFTTAEGGALTWNLPFGEELIKETDHSDYFSSLFSTLYGDNWNSLIYKTCQLLSLHGQSKDALAKNQLGSWEYDILGPWFKCNLTDIAAAIGLIQFERYPQLLTKRMEMIKKMDARLSPRKDISLLTHYCKEYVSSGHLYMVRLLNKTREETNNVIKQMALRGIATNVHYKPLPLMTAYRNLGFNITNFPNAFHLYENEITLPLYTKMTFDDIDYVLDNFLDILDSNK